MAIAMVSWTSARHPPGPRRGISGRFSFRDDQSRAGLSLEKSGDAIMGAVGFIRSLSFKIDDPTNSLALSRWLYEGLSLFAAYFLERSRSSLA
jgi:hypothetical protein